MTTPNHAGYIESDEKVAMRFERMKAAQIVAENADAFMNLRIGLTRMSYNVIDAIPAALPRLTEEDREAEWLQTGGVYMQGEELINWHNRVVFDVPAIVENTAKNMKSLKERIDARMKAAAERAQKHFRPEAPAE